MKLSEKTNGIKEITLSRLNVACYLYEQFTNYDGAYKKLKEETSERVDLTKDQHIKSLIVWLRRWGCRQFKKENEKMSLENIRKWYNKCKQDLPSPDIPDKNLMNITEVEFQKLEQGYNSLAELTISYRKKEGKKEEWKVGPTGAGKILFATYPDICAPWDTRIQEYLHEHYSVRSYSEYLKLIKELLNKLKNECRKNGFRLDDLSKKLKGEKSALPKLLDEYFWVTITKEIKPKDIFKIFNKWNNASTNKAILQK